MDTIKEGSAAFFTLTFEDENEVARVPATVAWRLDDVEEDGTLVQIDDWTVLTPASTINLVVPGASNDIIDAAKIMEHKLVTIRADVGLDTESNNDLQYRVRNIRNVP